MESFVAPCPWQVLLPACSAAFPPFLADWGLQRSLCSYSTVTAVISSWAVTTLDEYPAAASKVEIIGWYESGSDCKGNFTILRRILYLDLAKGNPK
jgi:hypothetical protein